MRDQLFVRDAMTSDVLTLTAEMSLEEAVGALSSRGVSGAPVVDAGGHLVGLLDSTDLLLSEASVHAPSAVEILGAYVPLPGSFRRFEDDLRHALGSRVADLMDSDAPAVGEGARLEDVATLMVERRVSRVPVVDGDDRVCGIVSRGDLIRAMAT